MTRIIVLYTGENKYSLNPIIASLDLAGRALQVRLVPGLDLARVVEAARGSGPGEPVIVLVSLMTTQLARPRVLEALRRLNREARRIVERAGSRFFSVLGGPHASGDPYGPLLRLGFDATIPGEGERAAPLLVDAVEEGLEGPELVRRLAREGAVAAAAWEGEIHRGRGRNRAGPLDEHPPFPIWRGIVAPIEIMRGCPWACRYCQVSFVFGADPRVRTPENVEYWASSMARLVLPSRGRVDLRFIAPDAMGYGSARGPGRLFPELVEVLERVKERYEKLGRVRVFLGSFPSEVRPDSVTEEYAALLARVASNTRVIVGAQSGSDRLLRVIGRGHTVEDVTRSVETLNRYGFTVDIDFIFGLPGETREDREETLKYIEGLVGRYRVRVHLHAFMPLPGTPFADAPPGRIAPDVRPRIERMLGRGLVYGEWWKQEETATAIDRLRREGVIITPRTLWRLRRAGAVRIVYH